MSRHTSLDPESRDRTPERSLAPPPIDSHGPQFNQAVLALGLVAAFIFSLWLVVPILGLILGIGAIFGARYGLFLRIFADLIKPRLRRPGTVEDPRPPRFAAIVGTIFLFGATVAFVAGFTVVGWTLALIVAALAGLAATTGLCIGCKAYVTAVRFGLIRPKAPLR